MGTNARRGLGFMVVAVLAFVLGAVTAALGDPVSPSTGNMIAVLSFGGVALVSLVMGLVLLAWGLFRG